MKSDPIFDMLAKLRLQPSLYIGQPNVESLFLYLAGYRTAVQQHTTHDMSRYVEFIDALYSKYGYGGGGHSWASVLAQKAGNDANDLDLFFTELDTFLSSQTEPSSELTSR